MQDALAHSSGGFMKSRIPFRSLMFRFVLLNLCSLFFLLGSFIINGSQMAPTAHAATLPLPSHIVEVIEENHSFADIIGSSSAPYINSLANSGALFTQSFAVTHPSEPNYLALFSGSTQGITNDSCPHTFSGPDLGGELIAAHDTFGGFSEGLPSVGSTVCTSGEYARKHNPWVNFTDVPSRDNLPFTSFPSPTTFSSLPTVSIVVPNLLDDMHDGTIQQGDSWLQQHIDPFVQWAKTNKSLLIVTWDEDDGSQSNQIPTLFVGPMVKTGQYSETINHFRVLSTLEGIYGLPAAHKSANFSPISDCWQ
jgi:phosphatidylinositol-3-phosphatase